MRNGFVSLAVFLTIVTTTMLFSAPAVAQVFYPTAADDGRTQPSDAQKKAVEESKASGLIGRTPMRNPVVAFVVFLISVPALLIPR
jgi:hypothetical protein